MTSTTNEIPRAYRRQLLPPEAAGVPAALADANERLRVAGLAAQAAAVARRRAEEEAQGAAKVDAAASVAAMEAGEPEPQPTKPAKAAEVERAREHERTTTAIAQRALRAMEPATLAAVAEMEPAQREDIERRAAAIDARLEEVLAELEGLEASRGVWITLHNPPRERENGRAFSTGAQIKNDKFNAHRLIEELRVLIAEAIPATPKTAGQRAEDDAVRAQQRAFNRAAQGGVYVGGE